jgi:hypothetical protein
MGYGNGSVMFENIKKTIDDSMEHINPFEEMDSDTGSILPEHVDQFLKDKKDIEHKKKEDEMVKNWQDEIEINKGGK